MQQWMNDGVRVTKDEEEPRETRYIREMGDSEI